MPAGAFFVFAKDGDEVVNGGVSATYVYGARMALANSADELIISNASGTLDQINWASSEVSNVVDGTSFLGADGLDPVGATITRSADGDGSCVRAMLLTATETLVHLELKIQTANGLKGLCNRSCVAVVQAAIPRLVKMRGQ